MPAPTAPAYTLPTIHLNGTGAKSLTAEYHEVYKAIDRACEALAAATCNARDFYVQGNNWQDAYQQAIKERAEALQKLKEVQDLAEAWMARASGDI